MTSHVKQQTVHFQSLSWGGGGIVYSPPPFPFCTSHILIFEGVVAFFIKIARSTIESIYEHI